jgi:hypothetical protein
VTAIFLPIRANLGNRTSDGLRRRSPLRLFLLPLSTCRNHWRFSRRIVTPGVPGMTTTDPSRAFAESSNQPEFLHGQNEVLAAGRIEATSTPEPWADQILVQFHCANCEKSRDVEQTSPKLSGSRRRLSLRQNCGVILMKAVRQTLRGLVACVKAGL